MNLNINDICLVENSSIQSLLFWRKISKNVTGLLCPCSIKSRTKLKIIEQLTNSYVMVQLLDSPEKLTVFYKNDLKLAPQD